MTPAALAPPRVRSPRVPLFQYPTTDHTLEKWKSGIAVDSYAATSSTTDMARSLLDSLSHPSRNYPQEEFPNPSQATTTSILGMASDIHDIHAEAMATAITMFIGQLLPQQGTPFPATCGPNRSSTISPTVGAGRKPFAISSGLRTYLRKIHKGSNPPRILRYPFEVMSLRRYLCAR